MEKRRLHMVNETSVVTGLLPTGEYGAYREQDDGHVRGYGHTRMAAIADLCGAIEPDKDHDEIDYQALRFDHQRDLRKHEA